MNTGTKKALDSMKETGGKIQDFVMGSKDYPFGNYTGPENRKGKPKDITEEMLKELGIRKENYTIKA